MSVSFELYSIKIIYPLGPMSGYIKTRAARKLAFLTSELATKTRRRPLIQCYYVLSEF